MNYQHLSAKKWLSIFLAGLLAVIACNLDERVNEQPSAAAGPFPRQAYTSVKVISIDRNQGAAAYLEHFSYLHGHDAAGIIDSTGHPVHNRVVTINLTRRQADTLSRIFRPRPMKDNEQWSDGDCSPVYRDAIVYYDSLNKPVAWVNICFTCERTMFVPQSPYMSGFDLDQHLELREFFKKLGYRPEGRP